MPLTFVHAADFHLGADLRRYGAKADDLRAAQYAALAKVLAAAADRRAAFVLICGDLFDRRRPSETVMRQTRAVFAGFPDIPVFIIPGTHDFLSEGSILSGRNFDPANSKIVVLNDTIVSPFGVEEADCRLYFRPNRSNRSSRSPIEGLARAGGEKYHIGLGHGSLALGGLNLDGDFPIDPADIKSGGLDYLALGHWHRPRREQVGRTTVVYAGIPQPLGFGDPEEGTAVRVTIREDGAVEMEWLATGIISFRHIKDKVFHPQQVKRILERLAGDHIAVKIDFLFSDTLKERAEVARIVSDVISRFFLVITDDHTERKVSVLESGVVHKDGSRLSVEFLKELSRLKQDDTPERSRLYDQAAELGVRLIKGEI